ncbi:uncharacterized protein LOC106667334 isoform X2 [Cimex lectularius]|nr:uncharacterized protein LOC106667334 isoform X2 [Cimex lectularius]
MSKRRRVAFPLPVQIVKYFRWKGLKSDLEKVVFDDQETQDVWKKLDEREEMRSPGGAQCVSTSDSEQEKIMVRLWSSMEKIKSRKVSNRSPKKEQPAFSSGTSDSESDSDSGDESARIAPNASDPDAKNIQDALDSPDSSNAHDSPGANDSPDAQDSPDANDSPDTHDSPDSPNALDIPDAHDSSDSPDAPDIPDAHDSPDSPDAPDIPEAHDSPDSPDAPDTPDSPDSPDAPDIPDTHDSSDREVQHDLKMSEETIINFNKSPKKKDSRIHPHSLSPDPSVSIGQQSSLESVKPNVTPAVRKKTIKDFLTARTSETPAKSTPQTMSKPISAREFTTSTPIENSSDKRLQGSKAKSKSLSIKDFMISNPPCDESTVQNLKTTVLTPNTTIQDEDDITENMINIKEIVKYEDDVDSQLFIEDINAEDEIFIIQCPKELQISDLEGQKVSLEGESMIRIKGEPGYECFCEKENIGRSLDIVLPSRLGRSFALGTFQLAGSIVLTKAMDMLDVDDLDITLSERIPLPDAVINKNLPVSPLKENQLDLIGKSAEKKKKKKKIKEENVSFESDSHAIKEEIKSDENYVNLKKRKRQWSECLHDSLKSPLILENVKTEVESSEAKAKKKKHRYTEGPIITTIVDDSVRKKKKHRHTEGPGEPVVMMIDDDSVREKKKHRHTEELGESVVMIDDDDSVRKKKKHRHTKELGEPVVMIDDDDSVRKKKKHRHTEELGEPVVMIDDDNSVRKKKKHKHSVDSDLSESILQFSPLHSKHKHKKQKHSLEDDRMVTYEEGINLSTFHEEISPTPKKKKKKHKMEDSLDFEREKILTELIESQLISKGKKKKKKTKDELNNT